MPTRALDRLLEATGIELEPVTAQHARTARDAFRDFGKGSGHPAGLNFGDCFSYALAAETGERLLFKGDDFSETDLRSAADSVRPGFETPLHRVMPAITVSGEVGG